RCPYPHSNLYPHHLLSPLFFPPPATPAPSTLSLHDALPILALAVKAGPYRPLERVPSTQPRAADALLERVGLAGREGIPARESQDRKSTRLNSSHDQISYAVFCLKKKKKKKHNGRPQRATRD